MQKKVPDASSADRQSALPRAQLATRRATLADVEAINALSRKIYHPLPALTAQMIRGHINNFPDGQFVAELEGQVVGYCATFIIAERHALTPHTWHEITGNGFAARHDPKGDWLYGMDVSVDPDHRRLRIGQRLYNARKALARDLGLKGIVFGGRMPGLARRMKEFGSAEAYLEAVRDQKLRDPVINFQISQGFEPMGVLKGFEPGDRESAGFASLMVWRNPEFEEDSGRAPSALARPDKVRVASVQYQMRGITSPEDFQKQVAYFVDIAADYKCDFVVLPELFTLQLLSIEPKALPPLQGIEKITTYTEWFVAFMRDLAVSHNINIIGGTQPTKLPNGDIRNVAYVFLRDGAVHSQDKIHPTPSEAYWWNIKGGDDVTVINTDCGPIGVLICYDSEFPELARHLADQGAMLLFVPFCTDDRRGFLRVRYCCHARAIENQMYVIMSGVVGNLPNVENMDVHYAESAILTPCDIPFARDGVAADTAANTETIATADLRLVDLTVARRQGSVRNFLDRRFDLYRVVWQGKDGADDKANGR
ncbi:MAG: GNAT family N-acetyltransferase [Alphaproteobacteria bacterium]|nr:GNAT family N-acetyltransferase [Alphaproteobacteria bacterium]